MLRGSLSLLLLGKRSALVLTCFLFMQRMPKDFFLTCFQYRIWGSRKSRRMPTSQTAWGWGSCSLGR